MKKLAVLLLSASAFLIPTVSFAAINTLNGLSGTIQTFATSTAPNSPHLLIQSSGTTHTFKWDSTPWLLSQGGTGATSFATSSIPFINNGKFSENNLQFFWDAINNILNVGGTTTPATKLSIKGSGSLGLFNVASSTGSSLFYISGAGNVGIATTSPSEKLEVVGNGKFSGSLQVKTLNVSATSTATGPVGVGNTNPKSALDISGAIYSRLVTAASSNIDWGTGNVQSTTLSSSPTLTFSNGQAGGEYKLILNQDGTGGRTVTWPSSVKWANKTTPTLTSSANAIDMVSFVFQGTYYLGSFTSNFGTSSVASVAVLAVAGGGGGGASIVTRGFSGGGGAGGVVYDSAHQVTVQAYTITVGSGGTVPNSDGSSNSGENSIFSDGVNTITALGGGGSSAWTSSAIAGGSGGGGDNNSITGGAAAQSNSGGGIGYGFAGGNGGSYSANGAGGGGGAGSAGNDGSTGTGGNGGAGYTSVISGSSVTYACGGGGGGESTAGTGGCASAGNAGNPGTVASDNSGSGGGAGALTTGVANGAAGGSGVVVISYPTGSMTATGGTITTSGGNTIHTFTSGGTFMVTAI